MKAPPQQAEPLTLRMVEEGERRRVARVELFGENVYRQSLENACRISRHVASRGLSGLVMDWRACVMTHNITELTKVAATFNEHLPADVKFAVIHRTDQLAYAIQMTRSLSKLGRRARAFTLLADALEWLNAKDNQAEPGP